MTSSFNNLNKSISKRWFKGGYHRFVYGNEKDFSPQKKVIMHKFKK